MATAYVIWERKSRTVVPGGPFPSLGAANAHIARIEKKQAADVAAPVYDAVAVTV